MSKVQFKGKGAKYKGHYWGPTMRDGRSRAKDGFTGWLDGINVWDCEVLPFHDGPIILGIKMIARRKSGGEGSCYMEVSDEDVPELIRTLRIHMKNKKNGLHQPQPVKLPKIRRKSEPRRGVVKVQSDTQVSRFL